MSYVQLPRDKTGVPIQVTAPGQTISFALSATGAVFASGALTLRSSNVGRIFSTVQCHILFVNTSTETGAATTNMPVPAGVPEYMRIEPNQILTAALGATITATEGSIWLTTQI